MMELHDDCSHRKAGTQSYLSQVEESTQTPALPAYPVAHHEDKQKAHVPRLKSAWT